MQRSTQKTSLVTYFSIILALLLTAFEVYFFWFSARGALGPLDGMVGIFTPDRVGVNIAWLATLYISMQLLSIPFGQQHSGIRFIGVLDGMVSLLPLSVVLIALIKNQEQLIAHQHFEVALILAFVNIVDLFGGYVFTIALSQRTLDFAN
jgi:hypothetical protein